MEQHEATENWWDSDDFGPVQEPWFTYGDHGVTFANARSVAVRWRLAQDLGVRGVVVWRLGGEDPAIWDVFGPARYRLYSPYMLLSGK